MDAQLGLRTLTFLLTAGNYEYIFSTIMKSIPLGLTSDFLIASGLIRITERSCPGLRVVNSPPRYNAAEERSKNGR